MQPSDEKRTSPASLREVPENGGEPGPPEADRQPLSEEQASEYQRQLDEPGAGRRARRGSRIR